MSTTRSKRMSITRRVGVALLVICITACNGGPTDPNTTGELAIRLTDAPIQGIDEVNVYIESLKVKHVGEPERTFAVDVGVVDLLTLQDSTMLLATASVEAGEYEYIMVELDQDRSSVTTGVLQVSVKIPSEKIKVFGPFTVAEDGTTTATLDFDALNSLQQLGNGTWLMTPIILLLEVES